MPCLLKKSSNTLGTYSPPLSVLRTFTTCSDCLSTKVFHYLNISNTSLLALYTYSQILCEKSSINVRKYLVSPMDDVFIGPHTLECTSSKILVAGYLHLWGMVASLVCPQHILRMQKNALLEDSVRLHRRHCLIWVVNVSSNPYI